MADHVCAYTHLLVYHIRTCWLQALTSLGCMEHRGACSADADSGDGAGIMTQVPWKLLKEDLPDLNEQTTGCAAYLTAWRILLLILCTHCHVHAVCADCPLQFSES